MDEAVGRVQAVVGYRPFCLTFHVSVLGSCFVTILKQVLSHHSACSFIEEPTSPDDILGHAAIRAALAPHGVGVATGEHCQNRVMFKQLLQASAIDVCQIDACRLGGVNEVLAVLLMAKK